MPVDNKTSSRQSLIDGMTKAFSALGYVYSSHAESPHQYFIRVLNGLTGGSFSTRDTSTSRTVSLIASKLNILPLSYLRRGQTQLFCDILNGIEETPLPTVKPRVALEDRTGVWLWPDGNALAWQPPASDDLVW